MLAHDRAPGARPWLSIITVVRNAAASIDATLDSVAAVKCADIEYIVVDGLSTDATVQRIGARGDLVDRFLSEADQGIYDAMNKGVRLASGRWLLFLNAGDRLHASAMMPMLAQAEASFQAAPTEVLALSGRVQLLGPEGGLLGYTHPVSRGSMPELLHRNCVAHQATLVASEAFRRLGGYSLDYRIMGDYEFWIRMLSAGARIVFVDQVLADFITNGVSSQRANHLRAQHERLDILVAHGLHGKAWARCAWLGLSLAFHIKSACRLLLGRQLSQRVALARARRS